MKQRKCMTCDKKFMPVTENQYLCSECIIEYKIGQKNRKKYEYSPPGPVPEAAPSVGFVIMLEKKGIYTAFSQDHEITNDLDSMEGISKK